MILHPHITLHELTDYCRICHEHGIRSVIVASDVSKKIRELTCNTRAQYLGIKFKIREK